MNTRFCASCGTGTQYTAIKPTVCSKCGKGFEAAFAAIVAPTPTAPVPIRQAAPVQRQPARRFVGARGRQILPPVEEPQELEDQDLDNEYVDDNQIQDEAEALASTISASDFVFEVDKADTVNSTDLLKPLMERLQKQEAAAAKGKPGRKGTRKTKR